MKKLVKVGWTHGPIGVEESKTAIDMRGLREGKFGDNRRGEENMTE